MSSLGRSELRGKRILVVDDDADNREMLTTILEHSGAVVATADCTAEAMRVLKSERSQVIITDIGLPGEDGFVLLRQIRALPMGEGGGIPAIALSGYGLGHDDEHADGGGFHAHLTKPVALDEMLAVLVRVLECEEAR